jgi:hypothetical protein
LGQWTLIQTLPIPTKAAIAREEKTRGFIRGKLCLFMRKQGLKKAAAVFPEGNARLPPFGRFVLKTLFRGCLQIKGSSIFWIILAYFKLFLWGPYTKLI